MKNNILIKNKKAYHNYEFLEIFECGIILRGAEIKSIRAGKVSFTDSYCYFMKKVLLMKNVHIDQYENTSYNEHEPTRERILLLTKKEMKKLQNSVKPGGLTIIPTKMFINDNGLCKVEIALAKGKKEYEKRNKILEKDTQRDYVQKIKM